MSTKQVYIKCPRCELNFIQKKDKFCPVCKQEMQALSTNYADEGANIGFCPICKVNYVTDDENVCGTCVDASELTEEELDALYGGTNDKDVDPEDEITDDEDDLEIISLEMEGEEEDDMDDEDASDPLDDFDDSLDEDDDEEN
ncbi:MAG: hypothetical protein FWE01_00105 [Firmicutes bacterium]|nr:hypothetical protein [Bacillota bacterium]